MRTKKPRLTFVSPVFLFPNDAGGKIRTTNILRGLKGGAFEVLLLSPATLEQAARWSDDLQKIADRFIPWTPRRARPRWARAVDLLRQTPVNVANDRSAIGCRKVRDAIDSETDLVVFDFVHSAVLRPTDTSCPSICFTHNVESEIFQRHAQQATNLPSRWLWESQWKKMERFEGSSLRLFSSVITVSDRDSVYFQSRFGIDAVFSIPTGVDLDFFSFAEPPLVSKAHPPTVVFTGSMDWIANVNGVRFFLEEVWGLILERVPDARLLVVGRNPPDSLIRQGTKFGNVEFTGYVDDVRPYVHRAQAFVIPLRVGGGTRIKAFEAMAMGCPIVSTSIGIEGLGIEEGRHFVRGDTAPEMANGVIRLIESGDFRSRISMQAREVVEQKFGHLAASKRFEEICLETLERSKAK